MDESHRCGATNAERLPNRTRQVRPTRVTLAESYLALSTHSPSMLDSVVWTGSVPTIRPKSFGDYYFVSH